LSTKSTVINLDSIF